MRQYGKIGLLFVALLWPFFTSACLWVSGTTIDGGHRTAGGHSITYRYHQALEMTPEDKIALVELGAEDVKPEDRTPFHDQEFRLSKY